MQAGLACTTAVRNQRTLTAWHNRQQHHARETFDFLGFTHICATAKGGQFWVKRITIAKRMRAKLKQVKDQLRRRMHQPIPVQGRWLASVVRGHMAYYGVPGNSRAVEAFRNEVTRHWLKALRRRSQKGQRLTWARMRRIHKRWLPPVRVLHPFPEARFAAMHPRQEPSAVIPHAGICAGGRPQGRSLPRPWSWRRPAAGRCWSAAGSRRAGARAG